MACFGLKQKSNNKPKNKPTSHRKNLQANGRKNKPKWLVSSQPGNTEYMRSQFYVKLVDQIFFFFDWSIYEIDQM